jgi:ParB/RepB/Spo0J family partition protein
MARTPRPSVRKTAALADKAPTTPLMPTVVVQEEALPLAALATTDSPFAMRLDLRADALADELKRDGQLNAIHVWSANGQAPYAILAGHRRTAAAKLLGWNEIRAIVHRNLEPQEAWRLAWKDNAERRTLSQQDRWWLVARLIGEGRNQATVAALLGVDKSSVSRDAGWTKLPEAVRDQVGRDGFSHAHAVELIPHVDRLTADKTSKILQQYRKNPCDRGGFRKIVAAHLKDQRKKWPKALKVAGDKVTVDLKTLDIGGLTPGQIGEALDVLRRAVQALEAGT